jgi:anti-sigma factor RsiW
VTHDDVTNAREPEQDDAALSHDAIGAYILGALPESERIAFEAHLRDCPECQRELSELGPIAALLPRLYDDLDLPGIEPLALDLEPSAGVKERIVAEAVVEGEAAAPPSAELVDEPPTIAAVDQSVADTVPEVEEPEVPDIASPAVDAAAEAEDAAVIAAASAVAAESTVEPVPDEPKRKPRGRIAPGEAPAEAKVVSMPRERKTILPWALAAAAAILATGAILWALAMMGQIDDLEAERDLQDQQLAQLNQEREEYLAQTPALFYRLVSTTASQSDDDGATGLVYMDPDPDGWGGIIAFRDMSQPPSGQVYQLWMITDGQVTPGPTFKPNEEGEAMVQVGSEAAGAGQMAITMEPDGGSESPTSSPIMQGNLTA